MRTLWPRLRAAWVTLTGTGAAASVAFGLLVAASLLASLAIPRESTGLRNAALQRVIATAQPGDLAVTVTAQMIDPVTNQPASVLARDVSTGDATLRSRLAADGLTIAGAPPAWASLTAGYGQVAGAARPAGYGLPQFQLTYRTALASYSHVLAGQLPGGAVGGVAQVAVTSATAARFGLRVGSQLRAGSLRLAVTGIIKPVRPAAAFWSANPLPATPALTQATSGAPPYWTGAMFIGAGSIALVEYSLNPVMSAVWWYPGSLGGLTAGQAGGLEAGLDSMVSGGAVVDGPDLDSPVTATVTTPIPSVLSAFTTGESAVDPVLELMYVSLAVMGAVVVLLGARLVGQRRAAEFTLMRARGAALYQLAWLVFRASVVIAAVAVAAAVALAVGLTFGDGAAVGWWLAGVTIAVTLVGPVLISVLPQRVAAPAAGRPTRPAGGRKPAARRIVIEAAAVAAAIGGLVVLHDQGLSSSSSGLYQSAAPVLIAIPVVVVVLRCYPPLARGLARIAGLSRGVVTFVGLARATRTPPGTVLPSFALVLVLAMVAFPDMVAASVTDSQVAASWQQVGADAIIQAPTGQVITPALQRQVSSVPGVVSTAAAVVEAGTLPAGYEVPAVFVDPAQYAAVADQAPGPRFPLAALSGTAGPVPVVATAAAAQLVGAAPVGLSLVSGVPAVTIRLAGRIGGVPGVAGNAAVVAPLTALGPSPPGPNLMLVAGPGLNAARLTAVVRGALPGATVTARATALAALTGAPVVQAAQTALTQGLATAAGFGVLVLLLSLLLTARTREMTLARLATMGLRRWQAQLLLATETLPAVVAAAIGGVACAWLLAPLVGPSLNLAAFAGTGSAIAVTPAVFPLVASAVGLVLVALLVLASSTVIAYHRGSARALRIAD
jgi:putative ABC transport system permease protein